MKLTNGRPARLKLFVLGLVASLGAACGGGSSESAASSGRQLSTYHTNGGGLIALRDRAGARIAVGSTTPYSPEQTCGGCHDLAVITQGYHFQQGKGLSNTQITVADTYNPAKPWLLSDGMYGKW